MLIAYICFTNKLPPIKNSNTKQICPRRPQILFHIGSAKCLFNRYNITFLIVSIKVSKYTLLINK